MAQVRDWDSVYKRLLVMTSRIILLVHATLVIESAWYSELLFVKKRSSTSGLPTICPPSGTLGSHIAHIVRAIETTLYCEVEAQPSCPRSLLSKRHTCLSPTGWVAVRRMAMDMVLVREMA